MTNLTAEQMAEALDNAQVLIRQYETMGMTSQLGKAAAGVAQALLSLQAENERLREALAPFANFADKWDAKPILGIDDALYGIHGGSNCEWGTEIKLSDCKFAREALDNERE